MFLTSRAKSPYVTEKMERRGVARGRRIPPSSNVLWIVSQMSEASSLTGTLVPVCYCLNQIPIKSFNTIFLTCVFYSVGASVIACARSNRHLIALEADEEIFDGLLSAYVDDTAIEEESSDSAPDYDYDSDEPLLKKQRRSFCA